MNEPTEALDRKARSLALLKRERIPSIDHLPVIEVESESHRRSSEEVARRAIAVVLTAVKGEGMEDDFIQKIVSSFGETGDFSPAERAFLKSPNPSRHERTQFAWRYECFWVFLWALGFVEELGRPDAICEVPRAVAFLREAGRSGFLKAAKLRAQAELLDAADLVFRYHWAVVDSRMNGRKPPADLDPGVVLERHRALNWLIGYMDQEWDDVTTDT